MIRHVAIAAILPLFLDLFNAEGRFLGTLRLPFALRGSISEPIVREGVLYGVTSDEAGVPYVVRGRVVKSG